MSSRDPRVTSSRTRMAFQILYETDEVKHIQAVFTSKDNRLNVPSSQFSIPVSATRQDLSSLISHFLDNSGSDAERETEFIIRGDLLRSSIENHLAKKTVSSEAVIEIEVIERNPPPKLADEFDHKDWVSGVHISTQYILTGSYDTTVRVWTHDGQIDCSAEGHSSPVKDVVWISSDDQTGSDGRVLFASASQDQNVHIWGLTNNATETQVEQLHTCKGHARSVESLAVNPTHDKLCSVSWDKMLKIWSAVPDDSMVDEVENEDQITSKKTKTNQQRATTRTPLLTLQGHTQPVSTVVWPSGEELLSAGMDCCIRVWDIVSGVNKSTLNGPKVFHCIHHSHLNSLVASANSDKLVRIWDTRAGESSVVQSTLASHQGWVVAVRWAPNREHQLLSGSYDSSLKVWDIRSSKLPLFTITAHEGKVLCLDWSLPQLLASGGTDNKLRTFIFP